MIPIGKPLQGDHHVALNRICDVPGSAHGRVRGRRRWQCLGPPTPPPTRSAAQSRGFPARAWYCKTEVALISRSVRRAPSPLPHGLPSGTSYAVIVKSSPTSPLQACLVADGVGTIAANECDECVGNLRKRLYGRRHGIGAAGLRIGTSSCRTAQGRRSAGILSHPGYNVGPPLQISSNGPFTLDIAYSANALGPRLRRLRSSLPHLRSTAWSATQQSTFKPPMTPASRCPVRSIPTSPMPRTIRSRPIAVDATTGALAVVGTPIATGTSPYAIVGTVGTRDMCSSATRAAMTFPPLPSTTQLAH